MVTMFITEEDYIQVSADALKIVQQATPQNRITAERRATDRITSYLSGRYDMEKAFATTGYNRNFYLVGLVADLALYFMVLSLPQKMGYEIRKEQFEKAIAYLEKVHNGHAVMNLPLLDSPEGSESGSGLSIRYGVEKRNEYIW